MKKLSGIHHITAITSDAYKIYRFFNDILGLRLVKKTVNQDDVNTYHLFFSDAIGQAGTDMTFFDFNGIQKATRGTDELSISGFRVKDDQSLEYYQKRFDYYDVKHGPIETLFGRKMMFFEDFDGQRYALFSDQTTTESFNGVPFDKSSVPNEYQIVGLGPVFITVSRFDYFKQVLTEGLFMTYVSSESNMHLFEMGEGGNGASLIIIEDSSKIRGMQGYGAIHHIAFRVKDQTELNEWIDYMNQIGAGNSGFVDRFYFQSLYTRLYPNVLFEFATDGPGFVDEQESLELLGTTLALPPKFVNRRQEIEKKVRPLDTSDVILTKEKEYF